jgi:3-deoxy-manno-octulosonate cytidylyltransferase (CMP-KDO synthetase)
VTASSFNILALFSQRHAGLLDLAAAEAALEALAARTTGRVLVVTDSGPLLDEVHRLGRQAILVSDAGASRLAALGQACIRARLTGDGVVVALSVVDLLRAPTLALELVLGLRRDPQAMVAVGARRARNLAEINDSSVVKVVFDERWRACYFSRTPLPATMSDVNGTTADSGNRTAAWWCATSAAAYRVGALRRLADAPVHTLERMEGLEALRAIGRGYPVAVVEMQYRDAQIVRSDDAVVSCA